ncbi:MAG: hypothetical protein GY796_06000 [Chloroflexi bacterium]|nr:hypothetical protein [Chloroflexota bacterium]
MVGGAIADPTATPEPDARLLLVRGRRLYGRIAPLQTKKMPGHGGSAPGDSLLRVVVDNFMAACFSRSHNVFFVWAVFVLR